MGELPLPPTPRSSPSQFDPSAAGERQSANEHDASSLHSMAR
jgi:hypothetical protein